MQFTCTVAVEQGTGPWLSGEGARSALPVTIARLRRTGQLEGVRQALLIGYARCREGVGVDNGLRRERIDLGRILLQVGPSHVEVLDRHPILRLGPPVVRDQHLVTTLVQSLNNLAADEHGPPSTRTLTLTLP